MDGGACKTKQAIESLRFLSRKVMDQVYDLVTPLGIVDNTSMRGTGIKFKEDHS